MVHMEVESTTIECVISGTPDSGRTSFLRRHLSGEYSSDPLPPGTHQITMNTNRGPVTFNIREDSLEPGREEATLLFVDPTSVADFESLSASVEAAEFPAGKLVVCLTKADIPQCPLKASGVKSWAGAHSCYQISSRSLYNYEKPFLALARFHLGPDVTFV